MTVITRVVTRGLAYPAGPLHRERWGPTEQACQVTVIADDGHEGSVLARAHCGLSYQSVAESVHRVLAPAVLGRRLDSIDDIEAIWRTMMHSHLAQYVPVFPVSAVDVALWDLLGKALGKPIAALLCPATAPGAPRVPAERIPVYASLPHADSVGAIVTSAEHTLTAGFAAVKVHGTADLEFDMRVCRTLRRELGDGPGLMYDGARKMTRQDAHDVGHALQELDFAWLEEPFGPFDHESYHWLAERCSLPVAAFETAPGGPGATGWAVSHRLATNLLIDCYWKAGLTGARQIVHEASAAGQGLVMHHGASSTMNAANVHLVAAYPELSRAEFLVPYGQYDMGITAMRIAPGSGLEVPTGPGLGVEADVEFLDRHVIADSLEQTSP